MYLRSESFDNGGPIPGEFALCILTAEGRAVFGPNRNPHLAWSDVPEGTRSLVLICHDPEAPAQSDGGQGSSGASGSRREFYQWVLIDIPPTVTQIAAGSHSDGFTRGGKPPGPAPNGQGIQGLNDFTNMYEGSELAGEYGGYDGPCPPRGDELVHHYHFNLYALDIASLNLRESITGAQVQARLRGHVLAEAGYVGVYSLNPKVRGTPG